MKLILVESPTKATTLKKFLGNKYQVMASYGHVRDLPKGKLGVDTEKEFEPSYVVPTKARKNLTALKKEAQKADGIILATDEDREGEAIAWHLAAALDVGAEHSKRIVFHEITKHAIQDALKNPRAIDMKLVNAQQARRILDRLVGYKLSPFLWKKVARGLSAGRVQSVAVRLVVDREREIEKFKPQEYFSVEALLTPAGTADKFSAHLHARDDKALGKLAVTSQKEADDILKALKGTTYTVSNVEEKELNKNPLAPFTTSTLQQAAGARFGYPAKRTMMLAQNLYERGFITYHRTDSLNLASSAIEEARALIEKEYGKAYLPEKPRHFRTRSKGAQEAHEAIRPSIPDGAHLTARHPDKVKLEGPQKKLYSLIWQRFVASQMAPARFAATTVDITTATPYRFRANGSVQKFPGFIAVYPMQVSENELPPLAKGGALDLKTLEALQHFTQPPARYSEAALVKALEKFGIGRPSTYASIISTIQERNYVIRNEQKRLAPTEIGVLVHDLLQEHFPTIVDIKFTARMEEDLDEIADGTEDWKKVLAAFYGPFEKNLEEKYEHVEKTTPDEETDKQCPECGKPLLKKMGRFGQFYACSGFPDCRHTENIQDPANNLNVHCPKCVEGNVVEKRTRRGKTFFGCSRYPDCDFATWDKPLIEHIVGTKDTNRVVACPQCDSALVEKAKKIACSNKECTYEQKMKEEK